MSSKLAKATECLKKGLAALEDGRRLDAEEVLIEGHDLVNGTIDIKDAGQVNLLNELKGTLMSCYERMGKFEEARQLSLQRLKIFEDIYGEESSKWSAELKTLSHLEFEILDKAEEAGQVLKACQQCMITTSMAAKALSKLPDFEAEQLNQLEERLAYCFLLEQSITQRLGQQANVSETANFRPIEN